MDTGVGNLLGAFEQRAIESIDSLQLSGRDYTPLAPETGLPVICLHGLTRNVRDFETVAPRIAALGRRVLAFDMRGRGASAYDPDPAHYVAAVYAQDVLTWLDALEIKQGVFIGTSMGGIITMVIAALAPDRIAASVLNDIGPRIEVSGLKRIGSYVGGGETFPSWRAAAEATRAMSGGSFPERLDDEAFWDAFARRICRERADGAIEFDYDPHIALAFADPDEAPPPDLTPFFQPLAQKPMLSVRGELSDILTPEIVAYMRDLKSDLFSVEIPRIGHAPILDEPESWDALLEFLAAAP